MRYTEEMSKLEHVSGSSIKWVQSLQEELAIMGQAREGVQQIDVEMVDDTGNIDIFARMEEL